MDVTESEQRGKLLLELWNWRGSKCHWVVNKSRSLPRGWMERTLYYSKSHSAGRQLCEHHATLCVQLCVDLNTHWMLLQKAMPLLLLMKLGRGLLNLDWPVHFPRTLCVCLMRCWREAVLWVSSGPHVLSGAEAAQSSNEKSRCRFYPEGGSPCLLIFNLVSDLALL